MMAGMKSGIKSSIIFGLILSLGLTLSGGMQVKAADDKKADKIIIRFKCVKFYSFSCSSSTAFLDSKC